MQQLEKTWRWFGPEDAVDLEGLSQVGVEGIVSSLHNKAPGEAWSEEEIYQQKQFIESKGLSWRVVESLPVADEIKRHTPDYDRLLHNYILSLENLAKNGINTVCYNFMPAIDWIRTDLMHTLPTGGIVMKFDYLKFIAFDLFILKRPHSESSYTEAEIQGAEKLYSSLSEKECDELAYNIIVLTQRFIHGAEYENSDTDYKQDFLSALNKYNDIDKNRLRVNLSDFLQDIVPTLEKYEMQMCIHPDDPPFPVLGLPRIVSTYDDLKWIFTQIPSLSNGLTFCSGSLSARTDNNLSRIIEDFGSRVYFAHLRNNRVEPKGYFYESGHIDGDINLNKIIYQLLMEQSGRNKRIPVRPDHGIYTSFDKHYSTPPGYPLIGRLKGLMEISGIESGILYMLS